MSATSETATMNEHHLTAGRDLLRAYDEAQARRAKARRACAEVARRGRVEPDSDELQPDRCSAIGDFGRCIVRGAHARDESGAQVHEEVVDFSRDDEGHVQEVQFDSWVDGGGDPQGRVVADAGHVPNPLAEQSDAAHEEAVASAIAELAKIKLEEWLTEPDESGALFANVRRLLHAAEPMPDAAGAIGRR